MQWSPCLWCRPYPPLDFCVFIPVLFNFYQRALGFGERRDSVRDGIQQLSGVSLTLVDQLESLARSVTG